MRLKMPNFFVQVTIARNTAQKQGSGMCEVLAGLPNKTLLCYPSPMRWIADHFNLDFIKDPTPSWIFQKKAADVP